MMLTLLMSALLGMSTVSLPTNQQPRGELVQQGEFCYTTYIVAEGARKPIAKSTHSVYQQGESWAVTIRQSLNNGHFKMRDEFLLEYKSLKPQSLKNYKNGALNVSLAYKFNNDEAGLVLQKSNSEQSQEIKLNGDVWDANLWGTLFSALPFDSSHHFQIPVFDYDEGQKMMDVDLVQQTSITVNDKSIDVYELAISVDDKNYSYFISSDDRVEVGYRSGQIEQWLESACH